MTMHTTIAAMLVVTVTGRARDASTPVTTPADRLLVTGRALPATMPAARTAVGGLPMNVTLTRDRRFAIVGDMGFRQSLSSIDVRAGRLASSVRFATTKDAPTRGLYYGIAIGADGGSVYAAGGGDATIHVLTLHVLTLAADDTLARAGEIDAAAGDFPAGVALDDRGRLFVTSNEPTGAARPPDAPGTLTCFDTTMRRPLGRVAFDSYLGTTNFPLAVAVTRDGATVFVAGQRDARVYVVDAGDPSAMRIVARIDTGSHPSALLLDNDDERLSVSNAGRDTVTQVDVATNAIAATVLPRPDVARHDAGVTPLGMSLAPDGKTLYVAAADLNAVAVLEMNEAEHEHALRGFVPAGWYPSAVATDGTTLLIANAKGTPTRYPNPPPAIAATRPTAVPNATTRPADRRESPLNLIEGDVLTRPVPTRSEIVGGTREVLELARLTPRVLQRDNPLARVDVKHVIYVVEENRSYDQVLGDLPQGNGDPSRCLLGRDVPPNQHALAERFVLLDNFYDCGEVSGDGWVWSTQAMAN